MAGADGDNGTGDGDGALLVLVMVRGSRQTGQRPASPQTTPPNVLARREVQRVAEDTNVGRVQCFEFRLDRGSPVLLLQRF